METPVYPASVEKPNLQLRHTVDGYWVCKLHYSCVPDYDFDSACVGMSEDQIERELEINWSVSAGMAVYPQFKWDTHVAADELRYWPDLPLHLGLDAPGTPALAITQLNPWGQWQIFPSLHPAEGQVSSFYEFAEWMAEHLEDNYGEPYKRTLKQIPMVLIGDPAGNTVPTRSDGSRQDMRSCWEILRTGVRMFMGEDEGGRALYADKPGWGLNVVPGVVSVQKRLEAVRARLTSQVGDGLPAFIIDPREDYIIRAFQGLYCHERYPDGSYSDKPRKDGVSHICLDGETLVETDRGHVQIRLVKSGDLVSTRSGWSKVLASWMTGERFVSEVLFSDGTMIVGTSDHRIWANNEWIEIGDLKYNDLCKQRQSPTKKLPTRVSVLGVRDLKEKRMVYNLSVEGDPEFYANGVLVHNCDALAYIASRLSARPEPMEDEDAPMPTPGYISQSSSYWRNR